MAGPLNGLGTGAQIPLANTFQPGQKDVRPEESRKQEDNTVKTRGSEASGSQNSETRNQDVVRARQAASNDDAQAQKRGSLVDITV
jgi:hypothetical protein